LLNVTQQAYGDLWGFNLTVARGAEVEIMIYAENRAAWSELIVAKAFGISAQEVRDRIDALPTAAEFAAQASTTLYPMMDPNNYINLREELVLLRRTFYVLGNNNYNNGATAVGGNYYQRLREAEAAHMILWCEQLWQLLTHPDTTPAQKEVVLSFQGALDFMRKGTIGNSLIEMGYEQLRKTRNTWEILNPYTPWNAAGENPTWRTGYPNDLDAIADQDIRNVGGKLAAIEQMRQDIMANRVATYARVKSGVEKQLYDMDGTNPAEVKAARAAYDALTEYERSFVTNYELLKKAEGTDVLPANIKWSGCRSAFVTPTGGPWSTVAGWLSANNFMRNEALPGTTAANVWIIAQLSGTTNMDYTQGVRYFFPWADLVARAGDPVTNTYRGLTRTDWERRGHSFQDNTGDLHERIFNMADEEGIYYWMQTEPGYADFHESIDIVYDMYGHHKSMAGMAMDVEWYYSASEDGGLLVQDWRAKGWLEHVKQRDPNGQLLLKEFEASRLPQSYRHPDLIFCCDAQSYGYLDGTVVGYYEARLTFSNEGYTNGIWYSAAKGEPIGMAPFYYGWSEHFYPSPVSYQIGYSNDRIWMFALDDPVITSVSTKLADVSKPDQDISIVWCQALNNMTQTMGHLQESSISSGNFSGAVTGNFGNLQYNTGNCNNVGNRFFAANPYDWGGPPTVVDAKFVASLRNGFNDYLQRFPVANNGTTLWNNVTSNANYDRLLGLEPRALDVRIDALPAPKDIRGTYWAEEVAKLRAIYNGLTDEQKFGSSRTVSFGNAPANAIRFIGVQNLAKLEAAEAALFGLTLTTNAVIVKAGDYFEVSATFADVLNSRAAQFFYTFDGDKFEYANFTGAPGVTVLNTASGDGFATITANIENAGTGMGKILLRAKEDAVLTRETQRVWLKVEYTLGNYPDTYVVGAVGSVAFTTVGPGMGVPPELPGDTNFDGVVDLIDLANMIEWFGTGRTDPDWEIIYKFFDFNNNGMIDIYDITVVARLI